VKAESVAKNSESGDKQHRGNMARRHHEKRISMAKIYSVA